MALSRAWDFVTEATVKGHGLAAVIALIGAFWATFITKIYTFCPDLRQGWFLIVITGLATGVAIYWKKPAKSGIWALVTAGATAVGMALYAAFETHCPGIWAQLPGFIITTIPVAIALAMKSPLEK